MRGRNRLMRLTKKELIAVIANEGKRFAMLHAFYNMPVKHIPRSDMEMIRNCRSFKSVDQYTFCTPITGEIGHDGVSRYVVA